MDLIFTPSWDWLKSAAREASTSIDVSSPYVGTRCIDLLQLAAPVVEKTLITSTNLVGFASGASDIESVSKAATLGTVLSLDNLHAKVYVFDRRSSLVTSANATYRGFHKNAECGMALVDESIATRLSLNIHSGFGAEAKPLVWTAQALLALVPTIERLKALIPEVTKFRIKEGNDFGELELRRADAELLLGTTGTWTDLVFRNMLDLPEEFTAQQIYAACKVDYSLRYPNNHYPDARIRNRLQALRDLGFIQFVKRGRFRRVLKISR